MMICALDLGKFKTVACLFDTQTQKYRFETILTKQSHVKHLLDSNQIDLLVMEACGPSGWIHDMTHERKLKTIVCSTNDEAWSWKNVKRKTDRDDALRLAKMAMMKDLSPVHVPKPEVREQRAVIKYRKNLDHRITRIKNGIRSIFANRGIEIDTGARAWNTGRTHIDSFRKPIEQCNGDDIWKGQLDCELKQLDALEEEMAIVETKLELFAEHNAQIRRVMTIPGVGRKTAEMLVAHIDDPHRFKNSRQVSSYLGLTPNYARIHGDSPTRRKKAGIALARKIAVVAWAMMRDETDWDVRKVMPEVEEDSPQEETNDATKSSRTKPAAATKAAKEKSKRNGATARPIKRARPKPPGVVHAEEPNRSSRKPATKTSRKPGTPRKGRSPMKT